MNPDALAVLATLPLRTRRAELLQRLQDLADEVMKARPERAAQLLAQAQVTEIALSAVDVALTRPTLRRASTETP